MAQRVDATSGAGTPSCRCVGKNAIRKPARGRAGSRSMLPQSTTPAFRGDMLDQDYFGFCTTLKPLELKALGELSRVQQLAEGETVYSTGDPAAAVYISSCGVVELIHPTAQPSAAASCLSRGDILG